jgi:hypothetical protein
MMIVDDPRDYGKWLPWSYEPERGRYVEFMECEDGKIYFNTRTNVESLIESNKAAFNDSQDKRFGDGKVIASIDPATYFNKLVPARLAGDDAWLKRWLNDPDNRAYRTFRGRV